MNKKIFAMLLVVITLFTTLAINTVSAASYSTGSYSVAASSGVNVRTGAGTGYSKVGAASKGTAFTVSKVSGGWGYTSSIQLSNGTKKAGWISLDYCTYKNSNRSTYNDVFASLKGSGYSLSQGLSSQSTTFKKGDWVYVWGYLHDANGTLYKNYGTGKCNMTLSLYRPDGSCAYTYTYSNCDNNWIGFKLDRTGTWQIQSKISGSLTGTNTRTITVKEASAYYTLSYNSNGGYNAPSSQYVKESTGFYLSSQKPSRSNYTFLGWSTSKTATSASYSPNHYVSIRGNVTLYAVWKKNTIAPTSVSLNYSSYSMNVGNTKQLTATVSPSNATNKAVTWSSSNTQVVSVSSNGKLTANAPGTATITVKTSNGKTKTCSVTVKGVVISGEPGFTFPTVGDVIYLSAKAYPSNTTKFTWSSSNSKVVSINSSGKMTAKAAGTATITAKTSDGHTSTIKITVTKGATWKTGNFDNGYTAKGYTTVALNRNAGDGKVKIYTYDANGKKSKGEMHVILRDWNGKWLCEFDCKSGDSLDLGDNVQRYRIYIAKKRYSDKFVDQGKDFINIGNCVYWAIECTKNTYIW